MELRDELIRAVRVLGELGCLPATDGNFSVRIDEHRVWLTRSGIEKRELLRDQLLEVRLDDPHPAGASSEWPMHRILYARRPEVNCLLHVHAPGLNAFALARRTPNAALLAETALTVGEIAFVPYATPGTDEVGNGILNASAAASVYILSNHGALAVGATVSKALHRLERAEFLARAELAAATLGGAIPLTDDQLRKLHGDI